MEAMYKILFEGKFKDWVQKDEFICAFSLYLGTSEAKAAKLYEVDRKIVLKKNLTDAQADRHMAAFEKMGMLVSKKLIMKPFVGPQIGFASRTDLAFDKPKAGDDGRKSWPSLAKELKNIVKRVGT